MATECHLSYRKYDRYRWRVRPRWQLRPPQGRYSNILDQYRGPHPQSRDNDNLRQGKSRVMRIFKKRNNGFTLVEMMMSLGCGSLILAAVVTAGVALQRSYAAVELYST